MTEQTMEIYRAYLAARAAAEALLVAHTVYCEREEAPTYHLAMADDQIAELAARLTAARAFFEDAV